MSKKVPFLYKESVKKGLWIILISICLITFSLEFLLNRYSYFADSGIYTIDGIFGFYSIFGLLTSIVLVTVARFVGVFIKKDEGYHNDDF